MRSNAHFRLLRLLRLQPRRPARKCAGRGSAPPRSCAADSAQQAYRAIDRLADAWGSWPRRRVFFEGDDTEPSNPPQTPLPQRIHGPSLFHCVLTCVLKPQSHRSYPQTDMGCRSCQTSRGTLLRSDRPRRVRAPAAVSRQNSYLSATCAIQAHLFHRYQQKYQHVSECRRD